MNQINDSIFQYVQKIEEKKQLEEKIMKKLYEVFPQSLDSNIICKNSPLGGGLNPTIAFKTKEMTQTDIQNIEQITQNYTMQISQLENEIFIEVLLFLEV